MKKTILTTVAAVCSASSFVHADGKAAFMMCSACHGADGKGLQVGVKKMAPTLAGSAVANGDPSVLALTILKGIKKEGAEYLGVMAPLEAVYADDQKLADVMTYVRQSFGNKAAAVTKEDAAKFRAQWKDVKEPVTRAKIAELTNKAAK